MLMRTVVNSIVLLALVPAGAWAGAKIPIDDEASIEIGYLLQTQYRYANLDLDTGTEDGNHDFILRRGRLRLAATLTEDIGLFLQTEATAGMNGGPTVRLIDAFGTLRLAEPAVLYAGEHMAPAGREITTNPAALLAIDRPAITNYNLTWGLGARPQFNTADYPDGDLGLEGRTNVRDIGATLFGALSAHEELHFKYYAGFYEGVDAAPEDSASPRFTARLQANLFDPEPDYYNLGTYLGEKRTVALGTSVDLQNDIARDEDTGRNVDYRWWELDLFVEHALGPGSVTMEWIYQLLELDGARALLEAENITRDARRTEGQGFATQVGYYLEQYKLQPWAGYELWDTRAPGDAGGFRAARAGLNYYIRGQNAKLYAGYEHFRAEQNIGGSDEDTLHTVLLGLSLYY
ncbi:MAG: porin [Desulfocurvibacter africanus]